MSIVLKFTHAFCREVQDTYRAKGKEAAMLVVSRKGFQGDISVDGPTCKIIVKQIAAMDVPRGNGQCWMEMES